MLPVAALQVLTLLQQTVALCFQRHKASVLCIFGRGHAEQCCRLAAKRGVGSNSSWHLEDRQKRLLNDLLAASVQQSNA